MKKHLKLTIAIVAAALVSSAGTVAAYEALPWTKNIYKVSNTEDDAATVGVFDDGDNKCYVVSNPDYRTSAAISCVKR